MGDDAFDRALRREQELREKVAAGDIDDDEFEMLRGFEEAVANDVRLSLDQARRLVDEGADPEVVAEVISAFPRISIDEAIEVVVDYGIEIETIRDLARAGLSDRVDASLLTEVFANDICPDLIRLVVAVGFDRDRAVAVALELSHQLCDPHDTLESLRRTQLTGLTVEQIATIADYEINPRVVQRLLDGDPTLDVDGAIRLLLNDYEPDGVEGGERSVGWVLDDVAVERSIAAAKLGATLARDVVRGVVAGLKKRSV